MHQLNMNELDDLNRKLKESMTVLDVVAPADEVERSSPVVG